MCPVIAIIGRPNVGKSTLFNVLTRSSSALVYNIAGVTRDRHYASVSYNYHPYILIDTGGLSERQTISSVRDQSFLAVEEATLIYFVVDARFGLTPDDFYISRVLRSREKSVILVINSSEGLPKEDAATEFYRLGFNSLFVISAINNRGVNELLEKTLLPLYPKHSLKLDHVYLDTGSGVDICHFTLLGRPNVGKSTLTNLILGQNRVIVEDVSGTTINSISVPFSRNKKNYTIVDTAGVRRQGKIKSTLEKFSVIKALKSSRNTDVVLLIIDAKTGIVDQDLYLINIVLNAGRGLVIVVNKCDAISQKDKKTLQLKINQRLFFLKEFIDLHFISAFFNTKIDRVFSSLDLAHQNIYKNITTSVLTQALKLAVEKHNPPIVGRSRIKLKYAHMGGHSPPIIVIHGNQVNQLPKPYRRYLEGFFRYTFKLVGVPLKLVLKQIDNPFQANKINLR